MMKKTRSILTCLFLGICSFAMAQNIQVTGTVSDAADGQPLPGATILVQGERTAFVTDNDGNYASLALRTLPSYSVTSGM
jgi:hypothetical protein